ncbi:MAG: hypothetical protein HY811_05475 [Planctomycetes bacterium]|nr:hypothetical protein [Planctomycetota bacterium]
MTAPTDKILFKAILRAPFFDHAPEEEVEKWAKNTIDAAQKTYSQSKKAIRTKKDYEEKIAKPAGEMIDKFISKGKYKSHEQIMNKLKDGKNLAAKKFFEKRKRAYESGKFADDVQFSKKFYAQKWVKYNGPLRGYKKGGIKGLGALAVMALSADKDLKQFLKKDTDKIIDGVPFSIALPDKAGKFKNALRNQITRSGKYIIMMKCDEKIMRGESEIVNQLANKYRLPEITPFASGGASHIDFIAIEIPNPAPLHSVSGTPDYRKSSKGAKPGEMIKQLGLDVQVSHG